MKNKKTVAAILILVILFAAAVACWFTFRPKTVTGSKTITVDVNHTDGTMNSYTINTNSEYLGDAMNELNLLIAPEVEGGLFVTIDGETVDESKQEWWGYTQNGEMAVYGIPECPIADGDHYVFHINVGW